MVPSLHKHSSDSVLVFVPQGEPGVDDTVSGPKGDPGNPGLPVRTITVCLSVREDAMRATLSSTKYCNKTHPMRHRSVIM